MQYRNIAKKYHNIRVLVSPSPSSKVFAFGPDSRHDFDTMFPHPSHRMGQHISSFGFSLLQQEEA